MIWLWEIYDELTGEVLADGLVEAESEAEARLAVGMDAPRLQRYPGTPLELRLKEAEP
jgi:hypothetical protein